MTIQYHKLYNRDSKGNLRVWWMEVEGNKFRTASGIDGGAITRSEWTVCEGKNIGKVNETTPEEQAEVEVEAQYKKKRDRKYYDNPNEAAGAKFIAPMLAISFKDVKELSFPVMTQPKLDGIRTIVTKDGAFSRQGKPLAGMKHIVITLQPYFDKNPYLIFDGEAYNHDLKDDFDSLVSHVKKWSDDSWKIQYHIYDLVTTGGFQDRHNMLLSMINEVKDQENPYLKLVPTILVHNREALDIAYGEFLEDGYEGQMIRLLDSEYQQNKRSKFLIKRKEFIDEEFPVVDILEGKGNWSGMAKKAVFRLKDGRLFEAGLRGTQDVNRQRLRNALEGRLPKTGTVRYQNLTPDGIPRFGVAWAFYDGERDV